MVIDAYKITSEVIADYPGLDSSVIHSQLKLILEEYESEIAAIGKPQSMAKKICHVLCSQERAKQLHRSYQYVYRPSEVKKALETVFDGPLDRKKLPDDYHSLERSSDGTDFRSDVLAAFRRLPVKMKASLYSCFAMGDKPANATYERKSLDKAIRQLTFELNGAT